MKINVSMNRAAGSSLAEVTLAVAIVGIIAMAIVGSFNYGFFVMGLARENQRATQVILEKAETIRLYRWDQIGSIPTSFTDTYDPHAPAGKQGVTYRGTCTLNNFPFATSYSTNLRSVVISVTWTNQARHIVRTRTMETLIAADGIQNYVY